MDDLLHRVERPSRYLGNELNAVKKDLSQVSLTVALAYPDLYEIGMSNTGLHILYYMLNERPDLACERAFLPGRDLEGILRAEARPLTTLENRVPLNAVDVLGIQLPHELAYANIVKLIRLARIPLWTHERSDTDPLILGGGPGAFAPEPVAPFYDALLLGDGEEGFPQILDVVARWRREGWTRAELHLRLAEVVGVYVPSLYEVDHAPDGRIAGVRPREGAPPLVLKAVVEDLEAAYYPEQAIVPYAQTVHDRLGVEVMRGCTVGCRFCQAGMIYRPLRERSPKRILDLAKCGLGSSGFEEVSLLSLDTGDYTLIDPLTRELLEQTEGQRVALSLPSLRAGSLTDDVIRDIRRVRRTSFTIAPEAGSQRLRDVINKNISDEEIFETVERVAQNGWQAIKLYFMVGFPTETDEDLNGLIRLVLRCRALGRKYSRRFNCTASLGTLVPKSHTPFQWDAQIDLAESRRRMGYVAHELRRKGVGCKYHDPLNAWLEGVFSRGDRRLAPVIADAEARGGGFESWDDERDIPLWEQVFADHGVDPEWYHRQRAYDEILPWDHLSARVTKKYLLNDRKKVDRMASPTTFDCRDDLCSGCAVCFEGDVRNRLAKYHTDPFADGRRLPLALVSRVAQGHGVARQLEQSLGAKARDQAAKAGEDALAAKLRRRRPAKPGKRRWAVTPGAPGGTGPAEAFLPETLAREAQLESPLSAPAEERSEEAAGARAELPQPGRDGGDLRPSWRYRLHYERTHDLRWLSHRETMRTVYRVLTRSGLPLRFTRGFHPKPKLDFGPPLPVGAASQVEELDLYLMEELEPEAVLAALRAEMPVDAGLVPRRVEPIELKRRAIQAERRGARWRVELVSLGLDAAEGERIVATLAEAEERLVEVRRPKRPLRIVDLKQILARVGLRAGGLEFDILYLERGAAKPSEVVAELTGLSLERARQGRYLLIEGLREVPACAPV